MLRASYLFHLKSCLSYIALRIEKKILYLFFYFLIFKYLKNTFFISKRMINQLGLGQYFLIVFAQLRLICQYKVKRPCEVQLPSTRDIRSAKFAFSVFGIYFANIIPTSPNKFFTTAGAIS